MSLSAGTFTRKIGISYHRVYVSGGRFVFAVFVSFLTLGCFFPNFWFETIRNAILPIKVKRITDTTSKFIKSPLKINYWNFVEPKVQVK